MDASDNPDELALDDHLLRLARNACGSMACCQSRATTPTSESMSGRVGSMSGRVGNMSGQRRALSGHVGSCRLHVGAMSEHPRNTCKSASLTCAAAWVTMTLSISSRDAPLGATSQRSLQSSRAARILRCRTAPCPPPYPLPPKGARVTSSSTTCGRRPAPAQACILLASCHSLRPEPACPSSPRRRERRNPTIRSAS